MGLFQSGDFTLNSGVKSSWKIECDALSDGDWATLARMAAELLPPFCLAVGVPRGGLAFASALNAHSTRRPTDPLLVAEDVVTTGGSMSRFVEAEGYRMDEVIGVCVFARGPCPAWVTPLFQMPEVLWIRR